MRSTTPPRLWNGHYYLFGDGSRCVVTFDVAACDPANQRPSFGRRIVASAPEEQVSAQGMPSAEAYARLKAVEERFVRLIAEARVPAWLVGKRIHHGKRELVFQVDASGVTAFDGLYAQVEIELGDVELFAHPGWSYFLDAIAPDERARAHIANRETLEALEENGADLRLPHVVEHTFVGDARALRALRERLVADGHVPIARSNALTFSTEEALDQDSLDAVTARMRAVAALSGARYDGWGAAPRRHAAAS